MMRRACSLLLACLLIAPMAMATPPQLDQARKKYKELDYGPMPALLSEALLQPGLTKADYVEIYRLQGFTYTVLGDAPRARDAFLNLLAVDPAHQMDTSVSPRFRPVFEKVKKEFDQHGAVSLTHTPPALTAPADGVDVEVQLKDAFGRVTRGAAKVRARVGGKEGAFVEAPLQAAQTAEGVRTFSGRIPDPTASIPGERPKDYVLEYAFIFSNRVGDAVPVQGAAETYQLTVGNPAAAAAAPAKDEPSGGDFNPLPVVLLGVGGAGVLGLGVLVVAGAAAGGVGIAACYFVGPCNQSQPASYGKVDVRVER